MEKTCPYGCSARNESECTGTTLRLVILVVASIPSGKNILYFEKKKKIEEKSIIIHYVDK